MINSIFFRTIFGLAIAFAIACSSEPRTLAPDAESVDTGLRDAVDGALDAAAGDVRTDVLSIDAAHDVRSDAPLIDTAAGDVGGSSSLSCRVSGPRTWTNVCGNTLLEPSELCDDGNLVDGDGCDSHCRIEQPACGQARAYPLQSTGDGTPGTVATAWEYSSTGRDSGYGPVYYTNESTCRAVQPHSYGWISPALSGCGAPGTPDTVRYFRQRFVLSQGDLAQQTRVALGYDNDLEQVWLNGRELISGRWQDGFRFLGDGLQQPPANIFVSAATGARVGENTLIIGVHEWGGDNGSNFMGMLAWVAPGRECGCNDGSDDDGDGTVDCSDLDCLGNGMCAEADEGCFDGLNSDGDAQTDCDDRDCSSECAEWNECRDGLDNDHDGDFDCTDRECRSAADCSEVCDDGVDNNSDGRTDCLDPLCAFSACSESNCVDGQDNDHDGAADCADPDCARGGRCVETMCANGIDDDHDGRSDCDDWDCNQDSSCPQTCGARQLLGCEVRGTTQGARSEYAPSTPSCSFGTSTQEVAYTFTALRSGRHYFSSRGSYFNNVLYVRDGGCMGTEIACDGSGFVHADLRAGQAVVVFVDGEGGLGLPAGNFVLQVWQPE